VRRELEQRAHARLHRRKRLVAHLAERALKPFRLECTVPAVRYRTAYRKHDLAVQLALEDVHRLPICAIGHQRVKCAALALVRAREGGFVIARQSVDHRAAD
jgi:hypothetical protein